MKFSIPYNGDIELAKELFSRYACTGKLYEIYAAPDPSLIGSGRRPLIEKFVHGKGRGKIYDPGAYNQNLEEGMKLSKKNGVRFNLLFNGTIEKDEEEKVSQLTEYIEYFYKKSLLSAITVGDLKLLSLIPFKEKFPKLEICASVYIRVNSVEKVTQFMNLGIDTIILSPEVNREIALIQKIKAQTGVRIKLIANEGCIPYCPKKIQHQYETSHYAVENSIKDLIKKETKKGFPKVRCHHLFEEDLSLIFKSPWMRPQDLLYYKDLVDCVKLAGRERKTGEILKLAEAYFSGLFEGDLRDILDTLRHFEHPIPNHILPENFFQKVTACSNDCNGCRFCNELAAKLKEIFDRESSTK